MSHVILDRPIAFHRAFALLTGSIPAGLMLSMAVQKQHVSVNEAWFMDCDDWEEETMMNLDEQCDAHHRLVMFPWWKMELGKDGHGYWYKVDLDGLKIDIVNNGWYVDITEGCVS